MSDTNTSPSASTTTNRTTNTNTTNPDAPLRKEVSETKAKKEPPQHLEMLLQCAFAGFYTGLALVDWSLDAFALRTQNLSLLRTYLLWKTQAPYLQILLFGLLFTLIPYNLFFGFQDVLGTFRLRASARRHAADIVVFVLTIAVVVSSLTNVAQLENTFVQHAQHPVMDDPVVVLHLQNLTFWHCLLFVSNIILLVSNFVRLHNPSFEAKPKTL